MKIKKISLTNFRRFEQFEITFEPQLTVLVAPNGAGKTSVLDAISLLIGPFLTRLPKVKGLDSKDTDFRVMEDGVKRPPFMRLECESYEGICWDKTKRRDQTEKTKKQVPEGLGTKQLFSYVDDFIDAYNENSSFELPVFAYYGTGRGVFDIPQRKRNFRNQFERFGAFDGALESRTNFRKFVEYFYYLEDLENKRAIEKKDFYYQLPELKAIREALKIFIPKFSNPRAAEPAGISVDWETENGSRNLRIEQLSDGYRMALVMGMDIASRMAEANPQKENILDTEGIVLIDEVDLHLHPGWQQHILSDLMRTFPNVQFIVSTHSPQVITSVKPEQLRVIEWVDDIPLLRNISFSYGAEAQHALLEILGVDSSRPEQLEIVKKLREYQELVENNKWETPRAKALRSELDKWGHEYEPELARLDIDIRMKELDSDDEEN